MTETMDPTFETVIREHHRRALGYAMSLVKNDDVAMDLVQDSFLTAYQRLASFDPSRDFGCWIRGIVRMKYLEWCRRRKEVPLEDGVLDVIEMHHWTWDKGTRDGRGDALVRLRECLERLDTVAKEIVNLFYTERKSCDQIAERIGSTPVAIRKRLERIRKILFDCVNAHLDKDVAVVGWKESDA